ncbi:MULTISPECIES: PH domain-containing protein [unclassified Micromonospora]|uniref:PH domain-containing protein n=1 Tax=unclassified Micromonospora TaxID=2617518 RepID=UPI00188E94AC|nr:MULTISPECIES: PH domain-containing protein [unclassified Micromonospora]MBF5030361.1 PH domain-containing protein [Micromonospora sp. ANENR4]MCZ7478218.1 PH domain-containing protein [Micromonospora sp. WMMC273]WBC02934.1 PH domain-containing protein [Micromonospora sp. WMMA1976]
MDPQSPPIRQWRVPREVPVLKAVGALALVALGLVFAGGDPVRPALAGLAAAGLLAWALRDVVAPVRLAVDRDGLTVLRGFAGRRRLPWDAVEAIRLDRRSRRGITAETLEIDAGESLHLFGRRDLDAPLDEVAAALDEARPAR